MKASAQNKPRKLNLGCGASILDGYVNVDIAKSPGVNLVIDLNKTPWPFEDSQFEEIFIYHTLEHLENPVSALSEMWRISKPGARIRIGVPYFASFLSFKDITHKNFFTYDSFDNWDIKNFEGKKYVTHMNQKMRFKILKRKINFFGKNAGLKGVLTGILGFAPTFLINLCPRIYERFFFFYFPASNIDYELEVVK